MDEEQKQSLFDMISKRYKNLTPDMEKVVPEESQFDQFPSHSGVLTNAAKEAYIDATEGHLSNPHSEEMMGRNRLVYNDFKNDPEAMKQLQDEVKQKMMDGTLNVKKRESILDRKPAIDEEYDADKINERLAKIKAMMQKR